MVFQYSADPIADQTDRGHPAPFIIITKFIITNQVNIIGTESRWAEEVNNHDYDSTSDSG